MGLLETYDEYYLPQENFLGWYKFENYSDLGPNSNDLLFLNNNSGVFGPNGGTFYNDVLEPQFSETDNFVTIINFSFNSNVSFISQILGSKLNGWSFCVDRNGKFFICVNNASGLNTQYFNTACPKNAILVFQKSNDVFSLSWFDVVSKRLEGGSVISFENTENSNIVIGGCIGYFPEIYEDYFQENAFTIKEIAFFNIFLPEHVVSDLCNDIFLNDNESNFLFSFVSTKLKNLSISEIFFNVPQHELGLNLPFSHLKSGFALGDIELSPFAVFYKNGEASSPDEIFDTYVVFSGASDLDTIIVDNLPSGYISGANIYFSGYSTGFSGYKIGNIVYPKRDIFDVYIGSENNTLLYNKNIVFNPVENLNTL